MYGAALYRLRPQDFGELKHVDGVSPAWPLSYDDFEPFYTKAEWLYQVHGNHGEDPIEGHWSKQYPWPAVSHEPRIQQLPRRSRGRRLPALPRSLWDPARRGRSAPQHLHPVHLVRRLPLPGSREVRCGGSRGAAGDRARQRVAAGERRSGETRDRLVGPFSQRRLSRLATAERRRTPPTSWSLSAGASNSAKILLASANDQHPNGLANASDQVGGTFNLGNSKAVVAPSKEPNDTVFQKTLAVNDFYFGAPEYDFPVGQIQMVGKSNAEAMKGERAGPHQARTPTWSLAETARHVVDFWLTTEDLPKPENRVTLDGDGAVHLSYKMTNDEEADRLYHELKTLLNHAGMADHHVLSKNFYMHMSIPIAGVAHQVGTCRLVHGAGDLGARHPPGKAHELDNLYVVDTSFFPSIGAVNPALTAIANAIRVGSI